MREILKLMLAIGTVVIGWHESYSQCEMSSAADSLMTMQEHVDVTAPSDMLEPETVSAEFPQYPEGYFSSDYQSSNQGGRMSDAHLLKEYELQRAKKMKKTSLIGGSILGGLGVATFITIFAASAADDTLDDESITENALIGAAIGGALVIGGGLWIGCAHYKANKLIQSVKYVSLVEQDLFSTGRNSMTASLDLINSKGLVKDNGFGLSLRYSF